MLARQNLLILRIKTYLYGSNISSIIGTEQPSTSISRSFFSVLLTFTGRATWTNLSWYSVYSERSMRRYARKSLNFALINAELLKHMDPKIIAMDATTIQKSGKHTFGLGKFWSSCDVKAVR